MWGGRCGGGREGVGLRGKRVEVVAVESFRRFGYGRGDVS